MSKGPEEREDEDTQRLAEAMMLACPPKVGYKFIGFIAFTVAIDPLHGQLSLQLMVHPTESDEALAILDAASDSIDEAIMAIIDEAET